MLVDVEPVALVVEVVDPEPGSVDEVGDEEEDVEGSVVDPLVVLVAAVAIGVNGPGLTCSPAAATICQARTVVRAVAANQIATRPKRFTPEFSQELLAG